MRIENHVFTHGLPQLMPVLVFQLTKISLGTWMQLLSAFTNQNINVEALELELASFSSTNIQYNVSFVTLGYAQAVKVRYQDCQILQIMSYDC